MFCPYAVDTVTATQTTLEYDDNGNQTVANTVEKRKNRFLACAKEECGAWHDGRCHYREIQ